MFIVVAVVAVFGCCSFWTFTFSQTAIVKYAQSKIEQGDVILVYAW